MTESFDWDDTSQEDNAPKAPKALREAYDKLKADNEALAKRVQDLADKDRSREVEGKLSARGLPAKAASLFPKNVEPTNDEVTKWIEQYGDLFGSPTGQTINEDKPVEVAPVNEIASGLEKMQAVSQAAPSVGPKNDLMAMLQNPNLVDEVPFEEWLAAMKANGALKT